MCFYLDHVHLPNNMVDFLYDVTTQIRPKLAAYLEYQKKKRRSLKHINRSCAKNGKRFLLVFH